MFDAICIYPSCLKVAVLAVDEEESKALLCRQHYLAWWRKRKTEGEGAVTQPHIDAPCRCGCERTVPLTGSRRDAFEGEGVLPYYSRECQKKDSQVELPCSCGEGCGKTVVRYKAQVEKSKTGRFLHEDCRKAGASTKPRKGTEKQCEGCPRTFYVRPGDANARFHDRECRTKYEQKNLQMELTCALEGCGIKFTAWRSAVERGRKYHSQECRAIGMITNAVPGQWHNGRPKRYDSDGYVLIYVPEHPNAGRYGWVAEHRWVKEQEIGRFLTSAEEVDHINEVKDDNSPGNLRVLDKATHQLVTARNAKRNRAVARKKLAAYERLFGPLPEGAS